MDEQTAAESVSAGERKWLCICTAMPKIH